MSNAATPEELLDLFVAAFNAADLAAVAALYEANAAFVFHPGQPPARGTAAIKTAMSRLLAARPRFELKVARIISTGETALLFADWQMTVTDAAGKTTEKSGQGTDVIRRQSNNGWLFVIDNPFGAAA